MDLAIATTSSFSYTEVSTMTTTENRMPKRAETRAIVEPRLQISREKLKRISNRSLERYLSAAEKLTD